MAAAISQRSARFWLTPMLNAALRATTGALSATESIVSALVIDPATELGLAVEEVARKTVQASDEIADAFR